jgi:uncharacterized protein YrrD
MLEDLHIGANVKGSDGKRLGTLSRIVIERDQPRVTHIVVDPGLVESGNLLAPGGWEKPRERVLPVTLITSIDDKDIVLTCDEAAFSSKPLFERKEFTTAEVSETAGGSPRSGWWSRFRVGELVNYIASGWGLGAAPYVAPADITYNEPAGASAIAEGTPVWRREPHEHVGTVERVLADPSTQRVASIVIRRVHLGGERRVLPVSAITDIEDDMIHTQLSDDELGALPAFEEEL